MKIYKANVLNLKILQIWVGRATWCPFIVKEFFFGASFQLKSFNDFPFYYHCFQSHPKFGFSVSLRRNSFQSSAGSWPTRPSCHFFNMYPASHPCPLHQAERASSDICASRPVLPSRNPLPNPERNNVRIPRMGSSTFLEVTWQFLLPPWLPNGTMHFPDLLPV